MKNKPLHKPSHKQGGQKLGPQTKAIHAGEPLRHGVGTSVGLSICRSSTFTFSSTEEMKRWAEGKSKAYIYTRYGNPTLTVVEEKIAALEGAEAAGATPAGLAARCHILFYALRRGRDLSSPPHGTP